MTYIDGPKTVDISSFQGSVNIDQVSAQLHKNGVPWLMMRAIHENGGVPDPVFLPRARAFESNGIHVSGYAFGVGNLPGAVLADKLEAIWPIQEGRGHNLDFEDNTKWGQNMSIAQAVAFVERAHFHMGGKRWPSVYGHSRFMGVPRNDTLRQCPYKIPTYGTSYVLPPTWQGVGAVAWQYSDGEMRWPVPDAWPRSFPGIGPCDMDALQVPWAKFAASVLGISAPKPPPPPPPKEGDLMTADEVAKAFGYSSAASMKARLDYAKGLEDGAENRTQLSKEGAYLAGYLRGQKVRDVTP